MEVQIEHRGVRDPSVPSAPLAEVGPLLRDESADRVVLATDAPFCRAKAESLSGSVLAGAVPVPPPADGAADKRAVQGRVWQGAKGRAGERIPGLLSRVRFPCTRVHHVAPKLSN